MDVKNIPIEYLEACYSQAGIFAIIDKEGKYVYVNKLWEKDTGLTAEEVVGKYCSDVISGSKGMIALSTKKPVIGDVFILTSTGRNLPGVIAYIPIFKDEEVLCVLISSLFYNYKDAVNFSDRMRNLKGEVDNLKLEIKRTEGIRYSVDDIIGQSSVMLKLKNEIYKASVTNSTVLIQGETGTGKELIAHAIHSLSLRNKFPFIKINCAAIPENLLESEFFGYEEGTFTGGVKGGKAGKFEKAHLGTMLLDEINQLDFNMQPKLLRVLQEKEVERVGGTESLRVDVRIIAIANENLLSLVHKNKFREDLYYRLNVIHITVPALREHKEDISLIVDYYIKKLNAELGLSIDGLSEEALTLLEMYDWPGNVRELKNIIERAMNVASGDIIMPDDILFLEELNDLNKEKYIEIKKEISEKPLPSLSNKSEDENTEKEKIIRLLEENNNNKTKVAAIMGISRTMIYKKLKKYGIK